MDVTVVDVSTVVVAPSTAVVVGVGVVDAVCSNFAISSSGEKDICVVASFVISGVVSDGEDDEGEDEDGIAAVSSFVAFGVDFDLDQNDLLEAKVLVVKSKLLFLFIFIVWQEETEVICIFHCSKP